MIVSFTILASVSGCVHKITPGSVASEMPPPWDDPVSARAEMVLGKYLKEPTKMQKNPGDFQAWAFLKDVMADRRFFESYKESDEVVDSDSDKGVTDYMAEHELDYLLVAKPEYRFYSHPGRTLFSALLTGFSLGILGPVLTYRYDFEADITVEVWDATGARTGVYAGKGKYAYVFGFFKLGRTSTNTSMDLQSRAVKDAVLEVVAEISRSRNTFALASAMR